MKIIRIGDTVIYKQFKCYIAGFTDTPGSDEKEVTNDHDMTQVILEIGERVDPSGRLGTTLKGWVRSVNDEYIYPDYESKGTDTYWAIRICELVPYKADKLYSPIVGEEYLFPDVSEL